MSALNKYKIRVRQQKLNQNHVEPVQNRHNLQDLNKKYEFQEEIEKEQDQQLYEVEEEVGEESQESGKYIMNQIQQQIEEKKKGNKIKRKKRKFQDLTFRKYKINKPQKAQNRPLRKVIDPIFQKTGKRKNGPYQQQQSNYPRLFILKNVYPVSEQKINQTSPKPLELSQNPVNILYQKLYKNYRLNDKIEMGLIDLADQEVMDMEIQKEIDILVGQINGDIQKVIEMDHKIRFLRSHINIDITISEEGYRFTQDQKSKNFDR